MPRQNIVATIRHFKQANNTDIDNVGKWEVETPEGE
jgi:hypothetical protein